jgi:hypothetical protein
LPASSILPDRSAENAASRARFPDYYYDLSRKHSRHLETVFWLEPSFAGETVGAAYERLLEGAPGIPWGLTLTRGLIAAVPTDPFEAARDSVNRGGNTFVLSHRALTSTPNSCLRAGGGEMRRSDMVWAIVNRHYRRMTIKQVDFPVVHVGQRGDVRRLDTAKVAGEVVGSAIYRALTEFLGNQPAHELDFACDESAAIGARAQHHRAERLGALAASFARIASLRSELRAVAHRRELEALDVVLDGWITPQVLAEVSSLARAVDRRAVEAFVSSLRGEADALDTAPLVDIAPLVASLYAGSSR